MGKILSFTDSEWLKTLKTDCVLKVYKEEEFYQLGLQVCWPWKFRGVCHLKMLPVTEPMNIPDATFVIDDWQRKHENWFTSYRRYPRDHFVLHHSLPDGKNAQMFYRFWHHLFQAVFVRMTYPSQYVYLRWSRVNTAIKTAVTATSVMWKTCKSWDQLEVSKIGEIQASVAHKWRMHDRTCTTLNICSSIFWKSSHDGVTSTPNLDL